MLTGWNKQDISDLTIRDVYFLLPLLEEAITGKKPSIPLNVANNIAFG